MVDGMNYLQDSAFTVEKAHIELIVLGGNVWKKHDIPDTADTRGPIRLFVAPKKFQNM